MSRNIVDIAANRAGVRPGEKYGLEVEAEGLPMDRVPEHTWSTAWRTYWSVTGDGSLRNGGIEFLSKPLTRTMVPTAVNALWPYFAVGRMAPSVRTGIHIHASCLGLNTDQVLRILQHYALVEPVMCKFVGPQREENIYCIPWYRSPSEATSARVFLEALGDPTRMLSDYQEPCKYSALFVGPLTNFGTIEFRHAPTWTDPVQMMRWWQMVRAVWETHATDYDVMERFNTLGPVAFARSILPFDWIDIPTEAEFEDADVEMICAHLRPQRMVAAVEWGRAPELSVPRGERPAAPTASDALNRILAMEQDAVRMAAAPRRRPTIDDLRTRARLDPTPDDMYAPDEPEPDDFDDEEEES